MLGANLRRMLWLAALLILVLVVRAWLRDAPGPSSSGEMPAPPPVADVRDAPPAVVASAPAVVVDEQRAPSAAALETRRSTATIPLRQPAVRLAVLAPVDVRVGDVFEVRIAVDATAPVRDLALAIAYERSRLSLIRRFEGEFLRQPGARAEYGIDEPSDGYVGVVFRAIDGSFATGAGDVVVLEFEALRPGTSRIELRDVKSIGAGGEANRNVVVTHASVTIH